MKRTKIITTAVGLCMAAGLLAGCGGGATGESAAASKIEGGQTQISVESSAPADVIPEGEHAFSYNGYNLLPGTEAVPAIEALGVEYERMEVASCAYEGMNIIYKCPGFTLYGYTDNNNVERIDVIEITEGLVGCDGVFVGDSVDVAKSAFGTPDYEDDFLLRYIGTSTELNISLDGMGEIKAIVYRKAGN